MEFVDWRSIEELCLVRSVELAACDFLRRMGHTGSLSSEEGGGGSGEELISPIRSKVSVSCAFVGTPAKSVLSLGQRKENLKTRTRASILLQIKMIFPVWYFAVQ